MDWGHLGADVKAYGDKAYDMVGNAEIDALPAPPPPPGALAGPGPGSAAAHNGAGSAPPAGARCSLFSAICVFVGALAWRCSLLLSSSVRVVFAMSICVEEAVLSCCRAQQRGSILLEALFSGKKKGKKKPSG